MALPNVPAYCLNPDMQELWGPECFPKEWPAPKPPVQVGKIDQVTIKGGFDPNAPPSAMESLGAWFSQNQTLVILGIGAIVLLLVLKGRR